MGCCNRETCNSKKEAFMDGSSLAALLPKFLEIVKTGVCVFQFKDAAAQELAKTLLRLSNENAWLKSLLQMINRRPDVVVSPSAVSLSFGPSGQYALTIPVETTADKAALASSLQAAVDELNLAIQAEQKQIPLPF